MFLPSQLKYEFLTFSYNDSEYGALIGKTFQVIIISDTPEYIPFVSKAESTGIKRDTIYVRRATTSERVNYEELQRMLNRRIETSYSTQGEFDLQQELQELEFLYEQIDHYKPNGLFGLSRAEVLATRNSLISGSSSLYPEEDYDHFILRMIDVKKLRIQNILEGIL